LPVASYSKTLSARWYRGVQNAIARLHLNTNEKISSPTSHDDRY